MKNPTKVAYFSIIAEIFSTGLAAQMAQKAEFCSTKILLMKDWVSIYIGVAATALKRKIIPLVFYY